jgi:ketosteroid isomerase-like protein
MSNLEMVQKVYEDFLTGNIESVMGALDADVEWIEGDIEGLPYAGTHHGSAAVLENVFMAIPMTYDSFELAPEEWVDGGDTIVMLGRITTQKDGREASGRLAQVLTVRDGKIVRFESFQDTHAAARVLGAG